MGVIITSHVIPAKAGFKVELYYVSPYDQHLKFYTGTTDSTGKMEIEVGFSAYPVKLYAKLPAGQVIDGVEYESAVSGTVTLYDTQTGDVYLYPKAVDEIPEPPPDGLPVVIDEDENYVYYSKYRDIAVYMQKSTGRYMGWWNDKWNYADTLQGICDLIDSYLAGDPEPPPDPDPYETEYHSTYRGINIYQYLLSKWYTFELPDMIYTYETLVECYAIIDEYLEPEPEPDTFIETYRGYDIWRRPDEGMYYSNMTPEFTAIGWTLEEIRRNIDEIIDIIDPPAPGTWPWPLDAVQEWFDGLWNAVVSAPINALQTFWTNHIEPKLVWIKDQIMLGVNWIYDQLEPIVSGIKISVADMWLEITISVSNVLTSLSTAITNIGDWIWNQISPVLTTISTSITTLWTNISTAVDGVITNITAALATAKELIFDKIIAKAGDIISDINTSLSTGLASLWTSIETAIAGLAEAIPTSVLDAIGNATIPLLASLGGELVTESPAIWYWVPPKAGKRHIVAGWIYEGIHGVWDGILKSLGNIAEMMFGAVQFVIDKLKDGVKWLIVGFMDLLTGAMTPGSPPKEIAVASKVLMQTMLDRQMGMIDAAYKSDPTIGDLLDSALNIQNVLMAAAVVAIGSGLAADMANPMKGMGFRPTVREMVYWSGIPAVTAAIATTPTSIGLLVPLRYALMEKWMPMVPPATDLIRFSVREVYLPERRDALIAYYPGGDYDTLMAKHGYKRLFREYYWMAHWVLPSIGQLNEMLYRGEIDADLWDTYVRYNDLIPEMIPLLEKIIYKPYTRVDIRRMWDMRTVTREEVKKNYLWLGYDEDHAEMMTVWTLSYTAASDLRALYARGHITSDEVVQAFIELGVPPDRAETFRKKLVDYVGPERTEKERDLTKTDILRMLKNGIFTANETMTFLQELGYSEAEADYLIQLYQYQPILEMKELTMSQILKSYRYEIFTRDESKIALLEAGWSEVAAETLLKMEDMKLADAQIERRRERDLSVTNIRDAVGAEIITIETGYSYLGYLGYSDWEVRVLFALWGVEAPEVPA